VNQEFSLGALFGSPKDVAEKVCGCQLCEQVKFADQELAAQLLSEPF
jgi:hypothetical protein